MISGILIGFLVGALVMWLYNAVRMYRYRNRQEERRRRREQRKKEREQRPREQRYLGQQSVIPLGAPQDEPEDEPAWNPEVEPEKKKKPLMKWPTRAAAQEKPNPQPEKPPALDILEIYRNFGGGKPMKLVFSESFASSAYFTQGRGYLVNDDMELLPSEETFRRINDIEGFTASGLFWAFDVMYRGERYTFEQLTERRLENAYVVICGCPARAVVCAGAAEGTYRLRAKGLLEIADQ